MHGASEQMDPYQCIQCLPVPPGTIKRNFIYVCVDDALQFHVCVCTHEILLCTASDEMYGIGEIGKLEKRAKPSV